MARGRTSSRSERRFDKRAGFTLIEMLITLAVIGVMATTVVLGLGVGGRSMDTQTEANRLADRLGLAVDEVLVTRRPLALAWDAEGYGFMTRNADGRWIADTQPLLGPRHALPRGLAMGGDAPALLVIGTDAATTPSSLIVGDAKHSWTIAFDGLNATASPSAAA